MWSRVVEIMLACWLAVSPFVFRHSVDQAAFWRNDLGCAVAVAVLAGVSFWRPLRYAHLLLVAVGGWMIVFGFLNYGPPPPPAAQNSALVGLLLMMFGLIPNWSYRPPESWERRRTPEVRKGPETEAR